MKPYYTFVHFLLIITIVVFLSYQKRIGDLSYDLLRAMTYVSPLTFEAYIYQKYKNYKHCYCDLDSSG